MHVSDYQQQLLMNEYLTKFYTKDLQMFNNQYLSGLITITYNVNSKEPIFVSNELMGLKYHLGTSTPNILKDGIQLNVRNIELLICNLKALQSVLEAIDVAEKLEKS